MKFALVFIAGLLLGISSSAIFSAPLEPDLHSLVTRIFALGIQMGAQSASQIGYKFSSPFLEDDGDGFAQYYNIYPEGFHRPDNTKVRAIYRMAYTNWPGYAPTNWQKELSN